MRHALTITLKFLALVFVGALTVSALRIIMIGV